MPEYKSVKVIYADQNFIFKLFEEEKPDVVINFAAETVTDRSILDLVLWEQM